MSDEEAALSALFDWLVSQTNGFKTTSRRLQHWEDVSDQPALFLRHNATTDEYRGQLQIRIVEAEIWIYSNAGEDPDVAPDVDLNDLVQQVRACFREDEDGRFTLNHLVYWCRTEGRSDYSPGDQGPQAIARIPVRITLP
jgi:hypothetical protein